MMNVYPLRNSICVRKVHPLVENNATTEGGIHIPDIHERHRGEYGLTTTVIIAGPDCDPALIPGTRVIVPEFSGNNQIFDTETGVETDYWIIDEGSVLAIISPEDDDA